MPQALRTRASRALGLLTATACVRVLVACSDQPVPEPSQESEPDQPMHSTLVVFAAASLRESFDDVSKVLEAAHAGLEVQANYAGSHVLRTQLEQGAHADVVATAALEDLEPLWAAQRVDAPQPLARNELVIAVRKGARAPRSLAELPNARRIVLGSPDVPVGRYARSMLERANQSIGADFSLRVLAAVVSQESNTRQVLAKVALGEADAAIVYRTDALVSHSSLEAIDIPEALNPSAEYFIATSRNAMQPGLAREWVELARSERGQAVLARHGFLPVSNGKAEALH